MDKDSILDIVTEKDTFAKELLMHPERRRDIRKHFPYMEVLDSDIEKQVLQGMAEYNPDIYSERDVLKALSKDSIDLEDFRALLSPAAIPHLEEMAENAMQYRRRHFGNSVYLFTPLYISNYCDNYCIYCGFNVHNDIRRVSLNEKEIEMELLAIKNTGVEEILLLTGESRQHSSLEYIGNALKQVKRHFNVVGIEIYPVNTEEYRYLRNCGADYVTVFQETYQEKEYEKLHLAGSKRIFPYRLNAQERAVRGGMRGVGFACLLGLADFRRDAFATGLHAYLIQKRYPHAEISISCPRLRPIVNNEDVRPVGIGERELLQIICAYRILLPFAQMTISTRESEKFRDNVVRIAATKISAGVSVGIGSYSADNADKGDEQFEIADSRSTEEILRSLRSIGMQPVMSEYLDTALLK